MWDQDFLSISAVLSGYIFVWRNYEMCSWVDAILLLEMIGKHVLGTLLAFLGICLFIINE